MKATASIGNALCGAAMMFVLGSAAHAASVRTFISGLGSDTNTASNCPRATPCRTLAAAYTVTSSGGEIFALDPAGYGPITITGPLSLIGTDGAAVAVATGTTGVTINAGAGDKIIISNFIFSGAGASSTTGIALNSGGLVLRNSIVKALTTGLAVNNSKVDLVHTDIIGNTTGITTNGTGVDISLGVIQGTGPTQVRIAWGANINNGVAYNVTNPGSTLGVENGVILQFTVGNAWTTDVVGYTTLIQSSGTGHVSPVVAEYVNSGPS